MPLTSLSDKRGLVDLDALDLDAALRELAGVEPRTERIITLRCFVGLTLQQIADTLEINVNRVRSEWEYGVAWLYNRLKHNDELRQDDG